MTEKIRVRFAPSPTGGLHLGGVRTVLYNYLFARHHGGSFILRIEDTDQSRFVPGAEEYIFDCLEWCGLVPDESVMHGGSFGPYRQSERKELYRKYAEQLINEGHAYYAFDTPEELDEMREKHRTDENPSPQYDHTIRDQMRNSLTLSEGEVQSLIDLGTPYVIRIKMPSSEKIRFADLIRGELEFETGISDDKVLLKADGMPTYHLAVVVDDYLMEITHAFRGEEWLPSAPVHVLLWHYLFGENKMPHWGHLPLIMGPQGKLSKRDGLKYGFPVFAMNWTDPASGELVEGFREKGFLPEAFINMLALLGWNDGTEKEIFSMSELIKAFDMDRVHKSGARFDYEKAKWFNHEWIKRKPASELLQPVMDVLKQKGINVESQSNLEKIIDAVKDRCTLLTDFYEQAAFFFQTPEKIDADTVKAKWTAEKNSFFEEFIKELESIPEWDNAFVEDGLKKLSAKMQIKPGELQLPLRIMLVGGKFGPPVFLIAELLGRDETISRIKKALQQIN